MSEQDERNTAAAVAAYYNEAQPLVDWLNQYIKDNDELTPGEYKEGSNDALTDTLQFLENYNYHEAAARELDRVYSEYKRV